MTFYPPKDAEIEVYLVYSSCATGTYIEGAFTNKTQAEAYLRTCKDSDRNNSQHWIRSITTQPHEV